MKPTRAQTSIERITAEWKAKPSWWHEVLLIGAFYALYTFVRNVHGSQLSIKTANEHAQDVVGGEQWLHIFSERHIQHWFLPHQWLIKILDAWYGSAHFIVTIGVLLWLYHMKTERYRKWRNVIFCTTFFALIGYLVYPLTPPRLLPSHYGFVDTLATTGGLWNFNNETAEKVSNQYAAMPSLHTGWALWCLLALMPVLKHWVSRVLLVIYPMITITTIVVTANHYWFDVAGGVVVFTLGYLMALVFDRRRRQAFLKRFDEARSRHGGHQDQDPVDQGDQANLIRSPFA